MASIVSGNNSEEGRKRVYTEPSCVGLPSHSIVFSRGPFANPQKIIYFITNFGRFGVSIWRVFVPTPLPSYTGGLRAFLLVRAFHCTIRGTLEVVGKSGYFRSINYCTFRTVVQLSLLVSRPYHSSFNPAP